MKPVTEPGVTISAKGTMSACVCESEAQPTDDEFHSMAPESQQLCGQTCPNVWGTGICGKPCRGYAGHEGPHQCHRHHTW